MKLPHLSSQPKMPLVRCHPVFIFGRHLRDESRSRHCPTGDCRSSHWRQVPGDRESKVWKYPKVPLHETSASSSPGEGELRAGRDHSLGLPDAAGEAYMTGLKGHSRIGFHSSLLWENITCSFCVMHVLFKSCPDTCSDDLFQHCLDTVCPDYKLSVGVFSLLTILLSLHVSVILFLNLKNTAKRSNWSVLYQS